MWSPSFGKLKLLVAFAIGYLAGAAAGRRRYEQIKVSAQRFAADPRVQSAAKMAGDTLAEKAPVVASTIKDKSTAVASAVTEKLSSDEEDLPQQPAGAEGTPLS
ncbi:MAG TPA: hypothetical protein PLZ93_03400 [Nocardioides sp.]|uniref:hypothetical protein n=1 Tax=uncultured Nocardioides sp. TaxID=198441 RepID=UPI002628CE64|nr:hypothetical protein [uncultured Nocardioides sp.]HRI94637.1 hypothetical protein [Nocardioides sp.]HRK44036.1 hypothetical protein [Nocardioides sp.]